MFTFFYVPSNVCVCSKRNVALTFTVTWCGVTLAICFGVLRRLFSNACRNPQIGSENFFTGFPLPFFPSLFFLYPLHLIEVIRVFNQTLRPEAELLLLLQGKFRKTELEGQ